MNDRLNPVSASFVVNFGRAVTCEGLSKSTLSTLGALQRPTIL